MRRESEIQDWIVQLAGKDHQAGGGNLSSVLRYDNSPLCQEMKAQVERFGFGGGLEPSRHRAAHEACRVLQSLIEPRFRSANTNITKTSGQVLKLDLVLEDEVSGAFVIVELKRSRNAAREFATELLGATLTQQLEDQIIAQLLICSLPAPTSIRFLWARDRSTILQRTLSL